MARRWNKHTLGIDYYPCFTLKHQWGNTVSAIEIWRDGQLRDWDRPEENVGYLSLTGDLISQAWQGDGTLTVAADGKRFTCTVTREGKVSFSE